METLEHQTIQVNGINLHYVTAGKGPLLLFLHGFPQFWYTWRNYLSLYALHYKVVAPDLRGYGDSDKPPKVHDYDMPKLVEDISALIKALGYEKARIVGHDWGGAIGWNMALHKPEQVEKLAVMNCPHPYKFAKALRSDFKQIKQSWYIFYFQLPYLPEWFFKKSLRKNVEKLMRGTARRKAAFTDADLDQYTKNLEKPGAMKAALNYYRAAFRAKHSKEHIKIKAPTLLLWGVEDKALRKELTDDMKPLFEGPFQLEYIEECGHWTPEEQPEIVNHILYQFLAAPV